MMLYVFFLLSSAHRLDPELKFPDFSFLDPLQLPFLHISCFLYGPVCLVFFHILSGSILITIFAFKRRSSGSCVADAFKGTVFRKKSNVTKYNVHIPA
jgi:hypothetical protein